MQTSASNGVPQIPGYQMLEKIGEGGMGAVYRAQQVSLNRTVAIKFIETRRPSPPQDVAGESRSEARVLASLNHPNVVTIHDCGETDGKLYLVMEFVSGPTLRVLMTPGEPWPLDKAAALVDAVAQALTYIHEQSVLHLDLKPENIMCDAHGGVKITDFGLASARVDLSRRLEQEAAEGTIDYSPPEQVHGLGTDQRSDLFSLATVAYELLTGRVPGRAFVKATQRNPRLPSAIDEVLRRGLARDPDERYATVREFRQAFAAAAGLNRAARSYVFVAVGLFAIALAVSIQWWIRRPLMPPVDKGGVLGSWFIYDKPEEIAWIRENEADQIHGENGVIAPIQRLEELPNGKLPLPLWPDPRPVLVISTPQATGLAYLFEDTPLGRQVARSWSTIAAQPPAPAVANLLRSGDFTGPVLGKSGPGINWIWVKYKPWLGEDRIALEIPPDRPDNQALVLVKNETALDAEYQMICFQLLPEEPRPTGTAMVLRYRARAETGDGRLAVGPNHAVLIPKTEDNAAAVRMRAVAEKSSVVKSTPEEDGRLYKLSPWVTPTRNWRTYCVIWEWPHFCKNAAIVITYAGLGKVWVDDLEMFTWNREASP